MKLLLLVLACGVAAAVPLFAENNASEYSEALQVVLRVRRFLRTEEGLNMVREYARTLDTSRHEMIFLIKAFIEGTSNTVLLELLDEATKGLEGDGEVSSDIHADFDKVAEYLRSQEGVDHIRAYFENLDTKHQIISRLKTLITSADDEAVRNVIDALLPLIDEYYYQADKQTGYSSEYSEALQVVLRVRRFLRTEEGLNLVREYARTLDTSRHSMIFLIKAFIEGSPNAVLLDLLNEVSKGLEGEGEVSSDIHADFDKIAEYLRSQDGVDHIRAYFENLDTQHQIISRLKTLITGADDDAIRNIIDALLPLIDEYYYSVKDVSYDRTSEIASLFKEIRTHLASSEGVQIVRDWARALEVSHPILFLVKGFIQRASEADLLEILDEFFSEGFYALEDSRKTLGDLFNKLKAIIDTEDGFEAFRNFLLNIQTKHAVVGRLPGFIASISHEALKEILDALFGIVE